MEALLATEQPQSDDAATIDPVQTIEPEKQAKQLHDSAELTVRDYKFHFFAWWDAPEYEMPADSAKFTDKDGLF